ncbi:hypothetical protein FB45DRAFT_918708 [Roridomyces roridus]|uniref:Uncharacterized protein n=1 Tax=Roridomyces roridus TaxID=1738132 RepID=A0AAD7FJT7_9AGAR|nr:hypothetical protein FB45DRAFT_918708 [Roridomyces roridus]
MSTSQNESRFPHSLPFEKRPALSGERVEGHATPKYALAWVCPYKEFYKNLGDGQAGKVDSRNFDVTVTKRWRARAEHKNFPHPTALYTPDGNFYLIVMFNKPPYKHTECADRVNNPVIESARVAMGVNADPTLESTLMWYRWPLTWIGPQVETYRRKVLVEAGLDPDEVGAEDSDSDSD